MTTSTWRAALATQGGTPTAGAPFTLSSSMWSKNNSFPSPIGKVDAGNALDVVNIGGQALYAQQYVLTVSQFDVERFVSLWLCSGGTWSGTACSGTIEQVGTTVDVTANGTYVFNTTASQVPAHFTIPAGGRLSLLLTNDSKGHTVPQNLEALSVAVSRSMSVRAGMSSNT